MSRAKIVDASKGGTSVVGATLTIDSMQLITASPTGEIVPFWRVVFVLSADGLRIATPRVDVPYMLNTDPIEAAFLAVSETTLSAWSGWNVTRVEDASE